MSRFDRYVLSQFLLFFGFFALVLVAVFWVNRAVILFDKLIGDGQSALVFLELSALSLPNLIRIVLPIAAFASGVWVTNRLNSESELTVLKATGTSPWQMARPALAFGIVAAVMMSVLTHFLLPASIHQLSIRESEIARNLTARLLSEGSFLHPTKDVTFFISRIDDDGTLNEVFLSDTRSAHESTIYTAAEAFLVRDNDRTHLIMVNGMAQRLNEDSRLMSTTVFSDFSYDISALAREDKSGRVNVKTLSTSDLMLESETLIAEKGLTANDIAEELHLRFARALICVAVALVGFSSLMLGSFSRFGVWRQVLLAFLLLVVLEGLRSPMGAMVEKDAANWPLLYLPGAAGLVIAAVFLQLASRPVMPALRRRREPS